MKMALLLSMLRRRHGSCDEHVPWRPDVIDDVAPSLRADALASLPWSSRHLRRRHCWLLRAVARTVLVSIACPWRCGGIGRWW